MRLIDGFMTECVIMNKATTDDGEGGTVTTWTDGAKVKCAIILDTSMSARVGEREGVTSVFTITTRKSVKLDYHDVIKRLEDGKCFRVTSDAGDKKTPKSAYIDLSQVTAEKWELT